MSASSTVPGLTGTFSPYLCHTVSHPRAPQSQSPSVRFFLRKCFKHWKEIVVPLFRQMLVHRNSKGAASRMYIITIYIYILYMYLYIYYCSLHYIAFISYFFIWMDIFKMGMSWIKCSWPGCINLHIDTPTPHLAPSLPGRFWQFQLQAHQDKRLQSEIGAIWCVLIQQIQNLKKPQKLCKKRLELRLPLHVDKFTTNPLQLHLPNDALPVWGACHFFQNRLC
jgi:hypothetical protein